MVQTLKFSLLIFVRKMKIQLNRRSHHAKSPNNAKQIKIRWFTKAVTSVIIVLYVYGTNLKSLIFNMQQFSVFFGMKVKIQLNRSHHAQSPNSVKQIKIQCFTSTVL